MNVKIPSKKKQFAAKPALDHGCALMGFEIMHGFEATVQNGKVLVASRAFFFFLDVFEDVAPDLVEIFVGKRLSIVVSFLAQKAVPHHAFRIEGGWRKEGLFRGLGWF